MFGRVINRQERKDRLYYMEWIGCFAADPLHISLYRKGCQHQDFLRTFFNFLR